MLPISYRHLVAALLCGLALRLYFIAHFPFYSGDTKFYEELARNWLDHGVYGLFVNGQLMPVDQRMPGYPAFLALIYSVFGRTRIAVMLAQATIDLVTCVLAALIASRIAPAPKKHLVATIALWLAALCPFTASYTAAIVTETLAAFFTTLALLVLVRIFTEPAFAVPGGRAIDALDIAPVRQDTLARRLAGAFALAGLFAGLGTLVRPETPLVLAAAAVVICIRWRRFVDWPKLTLAGAWMAVGLLAALTPWEARNARTLGRIEFLAPRYAQAAGDYMPRGFYAWTRTWMIRNQDAYTVTWALGKKPIPIAAIPDAAFDSTAERVSVADLLASYNNDLKMTPSLDRRFEALARERAAAHPIRTFALIPIERAFVTWFTPRVDVLRYSGKLWPHWRAVAREPEGIRRCCDFCFPEFCVPWPRCCWRVALPLESGMRRTCSLSCDSHGAAHAVANDRAALRGGVLSSGRGAWCAGFREIEKGSSGDCARRFLRGERRLRSLTG